MTITHERPPIAKERQTSLGLYLTAKEAYDMWQADPEGVKILDVRAPEEYVFTCHAPMATNIPFACPGLRVERGEGGFLLASQPRLRRARARALRARGHHPRLVPVWRSLRDRDQPTRGRGVHERLQHPDGMEGSKVDDPESVFHGMRLKNGWKVSGLPWTYDLDPERMALPERESRTFHPGNVHD